MPRLTVRISAELEHQLLIRAREDLRSAEGYARAGVLREFADRYLALLAAGRKAARRALTGDEQALLADAMNGVLTEGQAELYLTNPLLAWTVADALADGLAEKWGVDGSALLRKLNEKFGPVESAAVLDAVERFWADHVGRDPRRLLDEPESPAGEAAE